MTEPRRASKHRLPDADALALQTEYRRTGDSRLRDRLVIAYAGIVKHIVYRKLRELPAWCEVDDLLSCGLEALIAAVDRFDPQRGATFEQYAWTRVHGAVLDELRRQDWAPRPLRRWERDIAKAREHFVAIHRRRPTHDELADAMGIDRDHLDRLQQDLQASDLTSLNTLVLDEEDSQVERIDTILSDSAELDPERATERTQAKEKFRRAFARLTERERELAVLLYVKNLTLREIGEVLGVSESRVQVACAAQAAPARRAAGRRGAVPRSRLGLACRGGRVLSHSGLVPPPWTVGAPSPPRATRPSCAAG